MINNEYKCIFVHVIKTGGVSIATALNMKEKQCHFPASHIQSLLLKRTWRNYYKFSFVRNPWDKMISQYFFNHSEWARPETTFSEYIRLLNSGYKVCKQPPFHSHYLDRELDFIGRFENIQEDFNAVCDSIEIPRRDLPHKNKSSHKHYTKYYNNETIKIVGDLFKEDIERFGYEFE